MSAACCTGDDHAASLLFFFKQKQTSYTFGKGSTIKAIKTERDQLRSEAPPVVPSFAQASKRQHRDCARPPSLSIPGLRRNLDSDTRVHSSGLRTVQLADGLAVRALDWTRRSPTLDLRAECTGKG